MTMYIYIYIYTHVCMYIYIYIYTHVRGGVGETKGWQEVLEDRKHVGDQGHLGGDYDYVVLVVL